LSFFFGLRIAFVSTVKMERRRFSSFFGSTKKKRLGTGPLQFTYSR
jgi:hypothetical protein